MLKPIHPDGEGHPYQQTVEQASVEQASSLSHTDYELGYSHRSLISRYPTSLSVADLPPHFALALDFCSSPAITLLAWEQDLETLAVEEAF
ncbi:MAG: hypothetical protein F6K63_23245 [Moorea sp. SIO1G6]|uniref:Uncharacterized protein n=1 Tax=Moorena producens (strain JHB) TaxID=1454205 RepID=A0A1D9G885_MOOP1|nr:MULTISPECIES: hypothetical protein [Moorena]AOY83842.1 hypothetical protein BJP36_31895 [Moorena producens JHB]NET67140.1 hypothetical protein [Moorena sp. SIO1G6]